jgi:hypothetical protein
MVETLYYSRKVAGLSLDEEINLFSIYEILPAAPVVLVPGNHKIFLWAKGVRSVGLTT